MEFKYICCILVKVWQKINFKIFEKMLTFSEKKALQKKGEMIVQFDSATKTTNFDPGKFFDF